MTSGFVVVKYGVWQLLMFPEPLSKCSGGFTYIFFITVHPVTFISVDDSTLFQHRLFVLRSHQEASDGIASFEVDLHSIFIGMFFSNFHSALCNMAPLCKDFVVGCLYCYSYSFYGSFGLVFSF